LYEGEYKNGKKHGHGKVTWKNGKVYEGMWKDGVKNGQGKMKLGTGEVYDQEWEDGALISTALATGEGAALGGVGSPRKPERKKQTVSCPLGVCDPVFVPMQESACMVCDACKCDVHQTMAGMVEKEVRKIIQGEEHKCFDFLEGIKDNMCRDCSKCKCRAHTKIMIPAYDDNILTIAKLQHETSNKYKNEYKVEFSERITLMHRYKQLQHQTQLISTDQKKLASAHGRQRAAIREKEAAVSKLAEAQKELEVVKKKLREAKELLCARQSSISSITERMKAMRLEKKTMSKKIKKCLLLNSAQKTQIAELKLTESLSKSATPKFKKEKSKLRTVKNKAKEIKKKAKEIKKKAREIIDEKDAKIKDLQEKLDKAHTEIRELENKEAQEVCQICHDNPNDTVMGCCGAVICGSCLQNHRKQGRSKWSCPFCREPTPTYERK